MLNRKRNQSRSIWYLLCFVVWLVINIRVEAGAATVIERALDGLVGGIVLLVSIFLALRFFNDDADGGRKKHEGRDRW
ncbi:MAG: hypothetical protein ACYDBT_10875 [Desulfobulbaceae bacterium]